MNKITDFVVKDINLVDVDLSIYDGKTLLIAMNVASECGLTFHYEGLGNFITNIILKGPEILAFPCINLGLRAWN